MGIDMILKLDDDHTLIYTNTGVWYYYPISIKCVMDAYIHPLYHSFNSLLFASKEVLGTSQYKRPIIYYSSEGLNILMPTQSIKDQHCIWVSLNYCLQHSLDRFNQMTCQHMTTYQWSKLISKALQYKNRFQLSLELPIEGIIKTEEEINILISQYYKR